jgi:hypothetical protein
MTCILETWAITQDPQPSRQHIPNNRFNWLDTTSEQWEQFNKDLELSFIQLTNLKEDPVDSFWNHIRDSILKAAAKHIKKFKQSKKKPLTIPHTKPAQHIILLSQLLNLYKRSIKEDNHNAHQSHIQKIISILQTHHKTVLQIPVNTDHPAQNQAYLDWTEQLSQTVTAAKTALKTLTQSQTTADI